MTTPTIYLASADYSAFGVPATATDDQANRASDIVDAYTQRTSGLTWTPDATGAPLCMTRKYAESARTLAAAIVPGTNVALQLTPGPIISFGDVIVLNRLAANSNIAEFVTVTNIVDNNNVVVAVVQGAHDIAETAEIGLFIEETLSMPKNRTVVAVSQGPIAAIGSALGRISYGRRTDSVVQMQDYALFQAASAFGQAPVWQTMPLTNNDVDRSTNQIWCPVGIMMIPFTEVKINYVAGYPATNVPYQIKQATANIMLALAEVPASPNIKSYKAGDTQITRFLANVIDEDTEKLLAPFVVKNYV